VLSFKYVPQEIDDSGHDHSINEIITEGEAPVTMVFTIMIVFVLIGFLMLCCYYRVMKKSNSPDRHRGAPLLPLSSNQINLDDSDSESELIENERL